MLNWGASIGYVISAEWNNQGIIIMGYQLTSLLLAMQNKDKNELR